MRNKTPPAVMADGDLSPIRNPAKVLMVTVWFQPNAQHVRDLVRAKIRNG
jgi:hypothetical protein